MEVHCVKFVAAIVFICVAVSGLILLLFFMLDWQQDRMLIIYALFGMLAVVLGMSGIAVVQNTLGKALNIRRQAMIFMGRDGYKAVMKDRVARIAYKGVCAYVKGDLPQAEEHLTKALDLSDIRQNQVFCIEWLIRVHEAYNDKGRLMWCYRKSAEYSPDSPEVQSRLGHAYVVEGQLDKAMYCFEQALHYDPNHSFSRYNIAKIYMLRGEDEKALQTLEELVKLHENHPLVFAELATYWAMHGDEEKCREYYEKSIMCGYEQPRRLSDRMTAIKDFNNSDTADDSDLPKEYYRHIVKEEEKKPKCSSSCEYCSLNKKCEKDDNDAGNE